MSALDKLNERLTSKPHLFTRTERTIMRVLNEQQREIEKLRGQLQTQAKKTSELDSRTIGDIVIR